MRNTNLVCKPIDRPDGCGRGAWGTIRGEKDFPRIDVPDDRAEAASSSVKVLDLTHHEPPTNVL